MDTSRYVTPRLAVRPREPGDDAFIAHLSQEAFSEYTRTALAQTLGMTRERESATWVATDSGGERVGFIVLKTLRDEAYVNAVAVSLSARGRGVGSALLARAERGAQDRGARRMTLVTSQANVAALAVFYRAGFTLRQRKDRYYARGQNAVVLSKEL